MLVWICEYPYRTTRAWGPDPECEGCRRYLAQTTADRRPRSVDEEISALESMYR